jgi:hypothetical protein
MVAPTDQVTYTLRDHPFEWKDHPQAGTPIGSPERTRATLARWGWLLKE